MCIRDSLSSAADKINIIMAVSMGGDYCLAKPFDLSVLTAKVQACLLYTSGQADKREVHENLKMQNATEVAMHRH